MRVTGRWSAASVVGVMLGFARFGAALALVVAAFGTAAVFVVGPPNIQVTVPVSFTVDSRSPVQGGRPRFGFEIAKDDQAPERARVNRVEGSLRLPDTSKTFMAANGVILIVILMFVMFVLDQLRAVLRTLVHGNPFDPANGQRIRRVGFAVIAGELVRAGIVHAENLYAATHVTIAGVQFDSLPHVSVWTLLYGLVILIIAEVFRAGTRLDQDQSLTI